MSAYDAICFDLDRTLCESTQDADALLESAFDRAHVEPFCTPEDLRAAVPSLPTAETALEFYEYLFAAVAANADVKPTHAPTLAERYLEAQDPSAVQFRPGAKAALEHARERGPVGLITNGGRPTQTQKLESLDIADAYLRGDVTPRFLRGRSSLSHAVHAAQQHAARDAFGDARTPPT